jgi:2-methylcitrate dehydratase PrpD
MASLSRQLARWIVGLRYEDLPPAVVDRAKGVTLQCLSSILLGALTTPGKEAVALIVEEEAGARNGATIMVDGRKVTKSGAAFANSEMAFAGGKWDTFKMLMHPGTSVIPGVMAAAETNGASGRDFITAVAAAYEVMERLASDVIPTLMARGFHASPVFGIFGAAIGAAKIAGLDEEQMNSTIALCASMAGGNLEGARSGGRALREGAAVRNALFAVALARQGHVGGETVLEGDAGFYHAYVGNNRGELTYSFEGRLRADFNDVTANLGKDWIMLETLYRIYSISGYNIAHIDVTAALCAEHDIRPADIERIEAVVNWLETQYPSPAFPVRREDTNRKPGSTAYHLAYAAAKRGYPMLGEWAPQTARADDPPEILELMKRVTIVPSHTMGLFAPRITISTKDGKSHTKQASGQEFIWDFEEQAKRIRGIESGLPITPAQFDKIIAACRTLDQQPRADMLVALTIK